MPQTQRPLCSQCTHHLHAPHCVHPAQHPAPSPRIRRPLQWCSGVAKHPELCATCICVPCIQPPVHPMHCAHSVPFTRHCEHPLHPSPCAPSAPCTQHLVHPTLPSPCVPNTLCILCTVHPAPHALLVLCTLCMQQPMYPILPSPHALCAPSALCTMNPTPPCSMHHSRCAPSTPCTMQPAPHAPHAPSTPCTMHPTPHAPCAPCAPCRQHPMHAMHPAPHTPCAPCAPCTQQLRHSMHPAPRTPGTGCTPRTQLPAPRSLCTDTSGDLHPCSSPQDLRTTAPAPNTEGPGDPLLSPSRVWHHCGGQSRPSHAGSGRIEAGTVIPPPCDPQVGSHRFRQL
ncbi:proline-rich receptor-like protein kinase PERK2 [Meleagris gallopavo]|uniref:proline-rich receptor-like protein kinase PERK2 n=1 Tax=Meleagris gallopavo TaxID=9103 RepID=UPI0012AB2FE7|nr:proline-rich receptor-like protein kinase PERK2 [Meleagris gallopavo]